MKMDPPGCVPSGGPRGESFLLLFPASRDHLNSLALDPFLHLQIQQGIIFKSPCLSDLCVHCHICSDSDTPASV